MVVRAHGVRIARVRFSAVRQKKNKLFFSDKGFTLSRMIGRLFSVGNLINNKQKMGLFDFFKKKKKEDEGMMAGMQTDTDVQADDQQQPVASATEPAQSAAPSADPVSTPSDENVSSDGGDVDMD